MPIYERTMQGVLRNPFGFFARDAEALERGPRWPALSQVAELIEHGVHLLDNAIPIPGTRFRLGIDPIIGLVPVVGDIVGGLASMGVLFLAVQYRVPTRVLSIMVFNVAVDTAVGGIPVVGDLFDFVWKANERNYALLTQHRGDHTHKTKVNYWVTFGGLVVAGIVGVAIPAVSVAWLVRAR